MAKKRPTRRRPRPAVHCMDCGQRPVSGELHHDPTCPAAAALDAVMVDDRQWFETHPDAMHRCRDIYPAEITELADMAGSRPPAGAIIHVQQLAPGVRGRALYVPGDNVIPAGALGLFGHPDTFKIVEESMGSISATWRAALPNGMQLRLFSAPPGVPAGPAFLSEGLAVLPAGGRFPIPAAR